MSGVRFIDPRPLASLSAGMLARKGTRPLHRQPVALPPLDALPAALLATLDDSEPSVATIDGVDMDAGDIGPAIPDALPAYRPLYRPLPEHCGGRRRKDLKAGAKAAFTLRLDAARHLKLRLACALAGRSAQGVVIDALDRLLAADPLIEILAEQADQ